MKSFDGGSLYAMIREFVEAISAFKASNLLLCIAWSTGFHMLVSSYFYYLLAETGEFWLIFRLLKDAEFLMLNFVKRV